MIRSSHSRFVLVHRWSSLQSDTHVRRIVHINGQATYAVLEDLISGQLYHVHAKQFVVACGAVLSAQLLHVSKLGNDNVGRYLTDHVGVYFKQRDFTDRRSLLLSLKWVTQPVQNLTTGHH